MFEYLLLAAGIVCVLIAMICLVMSVGHWLERNDEESPSLPPNTRAKVFLVSSIVFAVFASLAYKIFSHLSTNHPVVLQNFGIWYLIGLVSYLLLLAKRHQILSPIFGVDWEEVLYALYVAIAGPVVTIHLIWRLLIVKEKDFFE